MTIADLATKVLEAVIGGGPFALLLFGALWYQTREKDRAVKKCEKLQGEKEALYERVLTSYNKAGRGEPPPSGSDTA